MIFLAAFFLELLILFLLARALTMHLSVLLFRIGFGEKAVMHSVAILFLPGTFFHEFSHYLMAVITRARVYSFSLLPKQLEGGRIKMGSIEHAKVDLFRNLLIGAGPFIFGSLLIFGLLYLFAAHFVIGFNWLTLLVVLVIFEIGNTMFSSKKDMEGSLPILLVILLLFGISYLLGFRISVEQLDQSLPTSVVSLTKQADIFLLVPIILDLLMIGLIITISRLQSSKF